MISRISANCLDSGISFVK